MKNINDKDNISELLKKGTKLSDTGKYEEAIECFDIVLRSNPKNEDALYNRGKSLYNYGLRPKENIQGFENKGEVFLEAMQFLDMALEVNPKFEDALRYMEKCLDYLYNEYIGSGIYGDALKIFKHSLGLCEDNLIFNHKTEELLYYKAIIYYYSSFEHRNSSEYFDKVLEINPNNVDALLKRAIIYDTEIYDSLQMPNTFNPDIENALLTCDKLLEINPNNVEGLCTKAYILMTIGKSDEALATYKKIRNIINNEEELAKIEGMLLHRAKEKSQDVLYKFKNDYGITHFEGYRIYLSLSKLSPLNVGTYKGAVESYMRKFDGFVKNYKINLNKLQWVYEEILKINPHNLEALNKSIPRLEFENAIKSFDKFLKYNPHNSDVLKSKLKYLVSKNKYEEAIKSCDDFLKDNPKDKEVLIFKGNLLSKLDLLEESTDVFEDIKIMSEENQRLCSDLELKIENIGPIHEADLRLGKINVVGGINGSGKSTAAKLLFSFLFSASPKASGIIFEEYFNELVNQTYLDDDKLREFLSITREPKDKVTKIYKDLKDFFYNTIVYTNDFESLKQYIQKHNEMVYRYMDKIIKLLNITDKSKEDFYISNDLIDAHVDIDFFMKKIFKNEFYTRILEINQINSPNDNIHYEGKAVLSGRINESNFNWHFFHNEESKYAICTELEDSYSIPVLANNVFYMNPVSFLGAYEKDKDKFHYTRSYDRVYDFELDFHNVVFLNNIKELPRREYEAIHHDEIKIQKIKREIQYLKAQEIIDDDKIAKLNAKLKYEEELQSFWGGFNEKTKECRWCGREYSDNSICPYCGNNFKIANIQNMIDEIIGGNFVFELSDSSEFRYQKNEASYKTNEISSGIQQIGIIQTLLNFGNLKKNDFLIIDEPELSLHPKWQFKLAEILVLLAKLDITVYVNSHSPSFIESINAFTQYYDMEDDINYYLTQESEVEGKYDFIKVESNELYKIYSDLGNVYKLVDQLRLKKRLERNDDG